MRAFQKLAQSVENLPPAYQEPPVPKEPPPIPPPRSSAENEIVQLNVPVTRGTRNKAKLRANDHGLTVKQAIPLLVKAWTDGHVEIPREFLDYIGSR